MRTQCDMVLGGILGQDLGCWLTLLVQPWSLPSDLKVAPPALTSPPQPQHSLPAATPTLIVWPLCFLDLEDSF